MKKIAMIIAGIMVSHSYASQENVLQTKLDQIAFQIAAKQWVTTKTAVIIININVTLADADLVKARATLFERLNKIAKGEWHLLQFVRSQDNSGLEKLYVQAQARVEQSNLTNIYKNAKAVSQPGASYNVSAIEFKPSLAEVQQVEASLRKVLYQQVKAEIMQLNQVYPEQHYTVNSLFFNSGETQGAQPQARYLQLEMNKVGMANASDAPPAVGNELTMTASAIVASNRKAEK